MQTNRSLSAWIQRWFSDNWEPDIAERIQPVVQVDDVSSLFAPPALRVWGLFSSPGAVVGENAVVFIQPRLRPIIVVQAWPDLDADVGIVANATANALGVAGAPIPRLVQGDRTGDSEATAWDGVCGSGTAPTASDPWGANNPMRIDGDTLTQLGVLVEPGQSFLFWGAVANTAQSMKNLMWVELPDRETLQTSSPRA